MEVTFTITDSTKGPFNLAAVIATAIALGSTTGLTVAPTAPAKPPRIANEIKVQPDPANTGIAYLGTDANLLPTAGGSTGIQLAATSATQTLTNISLAGVYFAGSANGTKISFLIQGGFQ